MTTKATLRGVIRDALLGHVTIDARGWAIDSVLTAILTWVTETDEGGRWLAACRKARAERLKLHD